MPASKKRARLPFTNMSGEEIPPYAFVQIDDGDDTTIQHILEGVQPTGSDTRALLTNGPKTIDDGAIGHGYWTYEVCVVAYDPGGATPVAGEEWGPVASSWYLDETGEGFIVLSVDSGKGVCRVAPKRSAGTGTTTTGAANCPCGTQYKRGSQTLTLNSVDYEHATTYTVTATCFDGTWWFPEVTYDTGTWLSGVEEILACYAGGIDAELQIEPFYVTIDGVDVLHAWAILTTDANDCTDIDSVAGEDVEAWWLCRNWNPLGPTAQFELMGPTKLGDVDLPKFLCVSPKASYIAFDSPCACNAMPSMLLAEITSDLFWACISGGPATESLAYSVILEYDGPSAAWIGTVPGVGTLHTSTDCNSCGQDSTIDANVELPVICSASAPYDTVRIGGAGIIPEISVEYSLPGGSGCLIAYGADTHNGELSGLDDFTSVACDVLPTLTGSFTSGAKASTFILTPIYI